MEPSIHISSPKLLCVCSLILLPGALKVCLPKFAQSLSQRLHRNECLAVSVYRCSSSFRASSGCRFTFMGTLLWVGHGPTQSSSVGSLLPQTL